MIDNMLKLIRRNDLIFATYLAAKWQNVQSKQTSGWREPSFPQFIHMVLKQVDGGSSHLEKLQLLCTVEEAKSIRKAFAGQVDLIVASRDLVRRR